MGAKQLTIEVAYALPERQWLFEMVVPEGTTVRQVAIMCGLDNVAQSGLSPEVLATLAVGIFGIKVRDPDHQQVAAGDRVELYRPLIIDPKEARVNRAGQGRRR
ncbi:RnfH family protein [Larsenimonas rhizosphaerae]|uniref:RnfH family protein n=1 Tax=Larsenimonas rhizosphaerae TaxID=2944682 RepID=UPI00203359BC|nr:RnfH family protein [Larsenimonas rhizosphaerae]MCM2131488.1 RnfH family protein [Larsenimonas rhizosphaerae]